MEACSLRGRSSAGRAPALQAGGQRFDPARLHPRAIFQSRLDGGSLGRCRPALPLGGALVASRIPRTYTGRKQIAEPFGLSDIGWVVARVFPSFRLGTAVHSIVNQVLVRLWTCRLGFFRTQMRICPLEKKPGLLRCDGAMGKLRCLTDHSRERMFQQRMATTLQRRKLRYAE